MSDSILSILTNFGCHWGCRYCVYRENGINIPHTYSIDFGWEELEIEMQKHKGETVSISGGGDPLYNCKSHNSRNFYDKLFELADKYKCRLELHTSIITEDFDYTKFERVVFHLTMPTQISLINRRLFKLPEHVRVVFVVQDYYNRALINKIVDYRYDEDNAVSELSFRQMIGNDGEIKYYCHDYLKEYHKHLWYYIEQNDYNEYFVQDHIEREYLHIKGE